ncbi:Glycosyl transferase family 2 (plasmid) [Aquisphaera giovannonii]|uniref:Glycosyl transferase family 2 n=1 Tax=Aquisphaera giovannonii TaxID=406548 RepID=A0A5B9WF64_9BACT|nr:glycosyltransferase [Aquisphaera giovannonii]QEH39222.1 Glycosyl transferase family 2 [Aquisphaera giovannonii]
MCEVGVIAIGRNEGERLRRCLESVGGRGLAVVYVDSGSSDGSVELALSLGAEVVELDLSRPFTAARARNEGFGRLLEIDPRVRFVQFVDGDCEVAPGWLDCAVEALEAAPDVAVVCGRRRERHPDRSVYNRLADMEWDTPVGEARACGGDAMMRAEAVRQAGGYDPAVIAAEDDELCVRIRAAGWRVLRLDAEMTLHDMGMTRFSQWWRRSTRTGHAYAEGAAMHGGSPERHFVRQARSVALWGLLLPLLALGLAWPTRGMSLALLSCYGFLYWRTRRYYSATRGWPAAHARTNAAWIVLAKFPQAVGLIRYWYGRLSGRRSRLIEYRGPVPAGG